MQLKDFLEKHQIKIQTLSNFLKLKKATCYSYVSKRRQPPLHIAFKIEEMTKGQVTAREMIIEEDAEWN